MHTLATHSDEVALALWFHDVVYDPRASDNEQRSARFAMDRLLAAGLGEASCNRIAAMILATASHEAESTDAQLVVDCDLAILGADPARFATYDAAVRREYAWVPEAEYLSARAKVLRRFLDRSRIYHTAHFYDLYEATARANILARLA